MGGRRTGAEDGTWVLIIIRLPVDCGLETTMQRSVKHATRNTDRKDQKPAAGEDRRSGGLR